MNVRQAILTLAAIGGAVQTQAQVSFRFDHPGLDTPRYTLSVGTDGAATYHAELALPKGGDPTIPAPQIDRQLALSTKTVATIFRLAQTADRFNITCASSAKNIADTGIKVLSYKGPDGTGQCTYNYSDIKPIVALTDIFISTETTLESGRRMDFKRRFDRLGLDAEMITLGNLLDSHQASGIETIVPTLQAIASDTELLQRVRSRAEKMLRLADATR